MYLFIYLWLFLLIGESQPNKSHLYFEGEPGFEDELVEGLTEEILEQETNEGESQAEAANESQADQDDDLNVANDVLTIARDIYLAIDTDKSKASLGEVYMKLGDISLEQGKEIMYIINSLLFINIINLINLYNIFNLINDRKFWSSNTWL